MNIPILYEDNHLIMVEKPNNVPVQQDRTKDRDLLTIIKEDIKVRYDKPGNVYLALIHRLDRPVGGAMVFAKTSKAASRMADLLRKRELKRSYLAVVRGTVQQNKGTLTHYLRKDNRRNFVHVVQKETKGAKKAVLHYEVLGRKDNMSFLHVTLETGRSHQIRVQFNEIGHPLYGDQKYGYEKNKVGEQIALWAHTLSFIHPVRRSELMVQSYPEAYHPWNKWIEGDSIKI